MHQSEHLTICHPFIPCLVRVSKPEGPRLALSYFLWVFDPKPFATMRLVVGHEDRCADFLVTAFQDSFKLARKFDPMFYRQYPQMCSIQNITIDCIHWNNDAGFSPAKVMLTRQTPSLISSLPWEILRAYISESLFCCSADSGLNLSSQVWATILSHFCTIFGEKYGIKVWGAQVMASH